MINFSNNSTNLRKIIYGDDFVKPEIEKIIKYDFIMFFDATDTNICVFGNDPVSLKPGLIDLLFNCTDISYTYNHKYLIIKAYKSTYVVEFCNKSFYIDEFISDINVYETIKSNFDNNKNMLSFMYNMVRVKQVYIKIYMDSNKYDIDFLPERDFNDSFNGISIYKLNIITFDEHHNFIEYNIFDEHVLIDNILETIDSLSCRNKQIYYNKLAKIIVTYYDPGKVSNEISDFTSKLSIINLCKKYMVERGNYGYE